MGENWGDRLSFFNKTVMEGKQMKVFDGVLSVLLSISYLSKKKEMII